MNEELAPPKFSIMHSDLHHSLIEHLVLKLLYLLRLMVLPTENHLHFSCLPLHPNRPPLEQYV